jgi:hypothetical protein
MALNTERCYDEHQLCYVVYVECDKKAFWLSVILLNVVTPHNTSLQRRKEPVAVS